MRIVDVLQKIVVFLPVLEKFLSFLTAWFKLRELRMKAKASRSTGQHRKT